MAQRTERAAVPRATRLVSPLESGRQDLGPAKRRRMAGAGPEMPLARVEPETSPDRTFNFHPAVDDLPEERSLHIEINGRAVATLLCSPAASRELAVGWAFAHGFFDEPADHGRVTEYPDRVSIMVDDASEGGKQWSSLVTAGFDGSLVRAPARSVARQINGADQAEEEDPDGWTVSRARFLDVIAAMFERFRGERKIDGLHYAAAGDGERVCIVARDLNRHNAVDKVVGWTLLRRQPRSELILCLTGRITAEIAYKAWRAGFPIVASPTMPTSDAVDLAQAAGFTLVGSTRDGQRAVFSHGWRLPATDDDALGDAAPIDQS